MQWGVQVPVQGCSPSATLSQPAELVACSGAWSSGNDEATHQLHAAFAKAS